MAEDPNLNMALEAVLRDRDDLYRRLMRAERKLKEMSDLQAMKDSYEARLSEKDKIIEAKDKAIESKDNRIASLERKLEYLERKVWGAMSEKRRLPDDPNQLKLDFGESDMTPEEEEAVRQAIKEAKNCRNISAVKKNISTPKAILAMKTNGYCLMKRKLPSILNINRPNCMSVSLSDIRVCARIQTGLSPLR